jgi:hypothetical protein
VREEGNVLLEVIGALAVHVDIAEVAAVAAEAGEFEEADAAVTCLGVPVLRLHERVASVREVSPGLELHVGVCVVD